MRREEGGRRREIQKANMKDKNKEGKIKGVIWKLRIRAWNGKE